MFISEKENNDVKMIIPSKETEPKREEAGALEMVQNNKFNIRVTKTHTGVETLVA